MTTVQSIERAFALLRAIAAHPQGVGITELAERTGLHKSTVSRLISTLEGERAVARVAGSSDVCLGPGLLDLLTPQNTQQHLLNISRPLLRRLCTDLNETVGLCVPEGDQVLFVDQANPRHAVRVGDWTGERYPMHATASGKLFLAFASEHARDRYLARPLIAYTDNTQTKPAELRACFRKIREQGYVWTWEEFELGLVVVAAPIFDWRNAVIGAVYVCGPRFRFPLQGQQDRITQAVVATCLQIQQQLPL